MTTPMPEGDIERHLAALNQTAETAWKAADGKLVKTFRFPDFVEAFGFMTQVALVAERLNHHPDWSNVYGTVRVMLSTHDAGGVTELDFELRAVDQSPLFSDERATLLKDQQAFEQACIRSEEVRKSAQRQVEGLSGEAEDKQRLAEVGGEKRLAPLVAERDDQLALRDRLRAGLRLAPAALGAAEVPETLTSTVPEFYPRRARRRASPASRSTPAPRPSRTRGSGTTWNSRIISWSSCSRMWQW